MVASSVLSKVMAALNAVTPDGVKAAAHKVLAEPLSGARRRLMRRSGG